MPSTYTRLFYHFVWTTQEREPSITPEVEPHLYRFLRHKCAELGAQVHALNGMPDHVHLACTLPTRLSIAEFMHDLKGSAARFINQLPEERFRLYWQPGYGALTFSRRNLPRVVAYIDGQKAHHATGPLSPEMERCSEDP